MTFQDLGWTAHPSVDSSGKFIFIRPVSNQWPAIYAFNGINWWSKKNGVIDSHIQLVTWKEYLNKIASKPTKNWNFSQEDILVSLNWGTAVLNKIAQKVHRAEIQVLSAEKLSALAWTLNRYDLPEQKLPLLFRYSYIGIKSDYFIFKRRMYDAKP